MRFIYQARNRDGQLKQGFVVAANQPKAETLLAENGYVIISIREQKENMLERYNPVAWLNKRVRYKDLVLFTRQLATLIGARVPILESLRILNEQIPSSGLRLVLRDMLGSIQNGESLSLAMSKHPTVFTSIYVSLIRAGEASGSAAESLNFLADQLEKDYNLRSKIRTALTYPGFVLVALVGISFFMFKFVLPSLTSVLKENGGSLPWTSKLIIAVTEWFGVYWWVVLLLMAAAIIGTRMWLRTERGRMIWDTLKMKIPILGDIFNKIYMARFSRNLATLVGGGIPIIQSLKIVSDVINNVLYQKQLLTAAADVTNGKSVSEALQKHPSFPALVTQMVRVGEQTASMDTILEKLASFYEKEVDARISVLSTLLEPIIMIILGIAVGILVAGVLMPIYNLAGVA